MKKFLKILEIAAWVLMTGGLFAVLGFTTTEHNSNVCKKYIIRIDYGKADILITEGDIYTVVKTTGEPPERSAAGFHRYRTDRARTQASFVCFKCAGLHDAGGCG